MTQKTAEATETNLDDTQRGVSNVYEVPPGRAPGTIDAKWGDQPPPSPVNYSTGAVRAAKDTRTDMIERLFDSPSTSAPAEQAAMSALFENARDGHPHSPLLQRGRMSKDRAETKEAESLTDTVMRVVGRR